jgi:hypothetical protein
MASITRIVLRLPSWILLDPEDELGAAPEKAREDRHPEDLQKSREEVFESRSVHDGHASLLGRWSSPRVSKRVKIMFTE